MELPLLRLKLSRLAGRKQTYLYRGGYVVLLVICSLIVLMSELPDGSGQYLPSSSGLATFAALANVQALGIVLFVPLMSCHLIIEERLRETWDLLRVSGLSARVIIIELFLSVMIPVVSTLMVGLPVLSFTYAFGGVTIGMICLQCGLLLLLAIRFASVGLACSAVCRTDTTALASCCVIVLVTVMAEWWLFTAVLGLPVSRQLPLMMAAQELMLWQTLSVVGISLIVSGVCLWLATAWLHRPLLGTVSTPSSRRPVSRTPEENELKWPTAPIFWRDYQRRWHPLIRPALIAVGMLLVVSAIYTEQRNGGAKLAMKLCLWSLVLFCVAIRSSLAWPDERIRSTFSLLKCCPLTTGEIIQEKLDVARHREINAMCLLGAFALSNYFVNGTVLGVLLEIFFAWTVVRMAATQGFAWGMIARSRPQAIVYAVAGFLALNLVPVICVVFIAILTLFTGILTQSADPLVIAMIAAPSPLTGLICGEVLIMISTRQPSPTDPAMIAAPAMALFFSIVFQWSYQRLLHTWIQSQISLDPVDFFPPGNDQPELSSQADS